MKLLSTQRLEWQQLAVLSTALLYTHHGMRQKNSAHAFLVGFATPTRKTLIRLEALSVKEAHTQQQPARAWFPTRIQDTLDYDQVVSRLYCRHIVTETEGIAQAAVGQYLTASDDDDDDPFAQVASSLSACTATRTDGGKIGWIERDSVFEFLPTAVVKQLFSLKPKAGDVHIIESRQTNRWHVVQVMEVWTNLPTTAKDDDEDEQQTRVGSFTGQNTIWPRRKKLKGSGVLPDFPELRQYYMYTAGCQMNVADSERLEGVLQHDMNLNPADTPDQADLILLNTCSIRDHAEQKLYDALGPFAARKRAGKRIALVVTGCVAQQQGQELLRRVPEIDVVLGPQYVPYLKNVLEMVASGQQMVATAPMLQSDQSSSNNNNDWSTKPIRGHSVRAWVNVIHGCNEHCTYCVVPATRGLEISRTMEAVLAECQQLAAAGYKEVTLLGQNIDAYGRDMVPKRTFAELLEFLNAHLKPDTMRIRYVTSHPRYFSNRVIDAVAHLDKVCECFHMPFQAGDDEVLKRMRRGYTYDSYLRIIDRIRSTAPDAAICADVIVGFPGESEEAFQKTLQLMEQVKFDNINSFAYSPRPNTEAALWEDQIDEATKADRLHRVQELATRHGLERSQRYLGRTEKVLIEGANPRRPQTQVMGRTRQGRQVYLDGRLDELLGEFVDVEITEARTWSLMGKLVQTESS